MITTKFLQQKISEYSTNQLVSYDEIIRKLRTGTITLEDAANFLDSNNVLSNNLLNKIINTASSFVSKVRLNEVIEKPKQFAEDVFALALVVFYLYFSTHPSLAKIHGQDPERAARSLVKAYSLYIGRRRGSHAAINPAFAGEIAASVDVDNLPVQRPAKIEESMNIKKLKLLIVEQRAEMAMQSQPPMDMTGEPDYEGGMARNELKTAARDAMALVDRLKESDQLPAWCQSKITMASEYIQTVKEYLESEVDNEETFEYETQE
jgi:hypothetical protein